jgi:uncharacterized membrane protein
MGRLSRLLRHRWVDEADAARALGESALQRLEAQVSASEQGHSGEVRLCIEASLPLSYLWREASARDRAETMFGKLRVWDTEHNNGVLIYLLLAEHAIEVVADRALARQVAPEVWETLVVEMGAHFRAGHYERGLSEAIAAVDAQLRQHFPLAEGQVRDNELPNRAEMR